MVPLDRFLMVGAGVCKRSIMCNGSVPVYLAEAHFESREWAKSHEKDDIGEEI